MKSWRTLQTTRLFGKYTPFLDALDGGRKDFFLQSVVFLPPHVPVLKSGGLGALANPVLDFKKPLEHKTTCRGFAYSERRAQKITTITTIRKVPINTHEFPASKYRHDSFSVVKLLTGFRSGMKITSREANLNFSPWGPRTFCPFCGAVDGPTWTQR